jgi:hypothetical protein
MQHLILWLCFQYVERMRKNLYSDIIHYFCSAHSLSFSGESKQIHTPALMFSYGLEAKCPLGIL